ncbi:MAG TPA: DUF1254 domain-containing protein [Polyangiaceae bacterium]|nr:DUF1254 domain-containing protein [Polyangiaceae bacterium]
MINISRSLVGPALLMMVSTGLGPLVSCGGGSKESTEAKSAASPGEPASKEGSEAPSATASGEHDSTEKTVENAYIYGYPMMVLDMTKQVTGKGVTNHLAYLPKPPDATFKDVVRPNVDTLYTTAFLDLTAEPVLFHMPDTRGRYYVSQLLDANTNVFSAPGKRTTGTGAKDFAIVGPGWKGTLPNGVTRIDSPTNDAWLLSRIQVNGEKDAAAVNALQREQKMAPLSEWPARAIAAEPVQPAPAPKTSPEQQVEAMEANDYFNKLAMLMRANPPAAADAPTTQQFAKIGLVPGLPFRPNDDVTDVLDKAKTHALSTIKAKAAQLGTEQNGWRWVTSDVGTYGTDYTQRAAVTYFGLGANLPEDAVYPSVAQDSNGEALDGTKHYLLHFDRDKIPPVKAFWSVTAYDKDGFLIANSINRFAARDSELKKNPDGSVDILLQADSPGADRQANWLPVAKGRPFNLLLRMYWPDKVVVDGKYTPPAVRVAQ